MADMMQGGGIAGAADDRTAALEKKVKELEALVKGLTEEFLDLKSVVMRLNRFSESRTDMRSVKPGAPAAGQAAGAGTVTLQRKGVRTPETAPAQAPVREPEKMDLIMQNDGTLKPEKRKDSNEYIVASANYNRQRAKPTGGDDPKRKNTLIVAEEDEKAGSKK